jgi:hypothetical protein
MLLLCYRPLNLRYQTKFGFKKNGTKIALSPILSSDQIREVVLQKAYRFMKRCSALRVPGPTTPSIGPL